MISLKFALLAVVTVLLRGSASTSETAASNECTYGFLDFSSIDETSSMIVALPNSSLSDPSSPFDRNPLSDFTQWIFPNVKFTCNGSVTTWRLRVDSSSNSSDMNPDGSIQQRPIPQITLWKVTSSFTTSGGITVNYEWQNVTDSSQATIKRGSGFTYYEYTPSPPTPVQAGDIVGIMMPSDDDARALSLRPLFLRLPEGNTSSFSCVFPPGANIQQIFLVNGMCINQQDQQSEYIPLVSPIFISSFSTTTPSSTPAATTTAPTPPANPTTTTTLHTAFTTIDLTAPPQPGANLIQLIGVIAGAISAVVALILVFLVALAIFLVLLTKRRGQKLQNVPIAHQPQNMDNTIYSQIIDSQSIEVKSNEAYSLSTTQQISTEDNVAYGQATPQIPTEDNIVCGQATPQIPTEDNIAYGQATSQLQITTGDNVAYGHREDDYATVSDPTEYDYV